MKIPYDFICAHCESRQRLEFRLNDTEVAWRCESCKQDQSGSLPGDLTIGERLMNRAAYELEVRQDYAMSIFLSAMSVECELVRIFTNLRRFDDPRSSLDRKVIIEEFRRLGTIDKKINATGKRVHSNGFKGYIETTTEWLNNLEGFPSLKIESLAKDFQREVFWPRNTIIHEGRTEFLEIDAKKVCSIANFAVQLFKAASTRRGEVFLATGR